MNKLNKINLFLITNGTKIVVLAIIFYIILFSGISLWKYYNFGYNAMDLAIINQVFYNSSFGNFFTSSIHPPTYLGDHFTPILFLFLPIYFLFRQPQTLLILQTIILGLCAWPIYLIAKKVLAKNWSVFLALAWLINPIVQNINLFEFHFLPFAIFFILFAFHFYQNQKFLPFIIFSLLAMLVREDVALVIFMFGIIAILQKKKIKWWLTPLIFSGVYFIFALITANFFAPDQNYKFFIYYSWFGETPLEALKNLFLKPWLVIIQFLRFSNLIFFLGLILPVVFIPLISPFYLLLGLIVFSQLALGSTGGSTALLQTHYSSLLLPAVFIATIYSIKKINDNKATDKIILIIKKYFDLAFLILIVGLIYSTLTLGPIVSSVTTIFQNGLLTTDSKIKQEILQKIPKNSAVAATYEMLAPLSSQSNIYSFNYVFLEKQQFLTKDYILPKDTEYLIIDFQDLITYQLQYGNNPFYQNQYQKVQKKWGKHLAGFGLIEIKDSIALYQKGVEDKFTLIEILTNLPETLVEKNIPLDDQIKFIGFNQIKNQYQLFWQIDFPLEKNYQFKLKIVDKEKEKIIYQKMYPLAYNLLIDDNLGKKIIQTNYWFEFDENIKTGNYNLLIDLVEIISGGIEADSIKSTKNAIEESLIGQEILLSQITI